ncbi:MAG: hypothetical protein EBY51_07750 [Actinobacteria bacterium]|nr:hypothetical protein [Actinomycetota bacterium]
MGDQKPRIRGEALGYTCGDIDGDIDGGWPSLTLEVYMDRGWDGMRWTVTGDVVGSAEIWLEEHTPGVLLHHYLRADPTRPGSAYEPRAVGSGRRAQRQIARLRRRYVHAWKKIAWSLKDELERDARQHR